MQDTCVLVKCEFKSRYIIGSTFSDTGSIQHTKVFLFMNTLFKEYRSSHTYFDYFYALNTSIDFLCYKSASIK